MFWGEGTLGEFFSVMNALQSLGAARCRSCLAALLRTENGGSNKSVRIRGVDVGAGGSVLFSVFHTNG